MRRHVWFGTKDHMQWIPTPKVDVPAGKTGFSNAVQFMNGGQWQRKSKASAKKYTFSWNLKSRDAIRPVLDYNDGLYGDGWIYYCHPFAMDKNVCPAYWATPYINAYDGPVVVDDARPELVNTGSVVNGFPIESAIYTVTSTSRIPSVFLPIPPGYTLHIGAHGELLSGSAAVKIIEHITPAGGPESNLTLLTKTDALTNYTVSGSTYTGVTITLTSASTGQLQLDGIIAQVLKDGADAPTGPFISGQGQSGMEFAGDPEVSDYNVAYDLVGVSANFIETEAWAWR